MIFGTFSLTLVSQVAISVVLEARHELGVDIMGAGRLEEDLTITVKLT